jgi:Predicted membrane protein
MPGYSIVEALYPRGDELAPLERLALSIGLSLAVVPLVGLILNYTPWGIRLIPIVISNTALTIALLTVAALRKARYASTPKDCFT